MRFLVIENNDAQAQMIKTALIEYGYVVDVVIDSVQGWDYIQTFTYDLILLDVSLPTMDGMSFCRRLRSQGYNVPILLLTAKGSSTNKVAGLDAGADDYVVKPYTMTELSARIRALLRRPSNSGSPLLIWNNLHLDPSSHEVTHQGKRLSLSPKEYSLLELFLRNPKRVLTRSAILEHLWSFETPPGEDTIRAHIKRLRRKLKTNGIDEMIETVYGIGYRLKSTLNPADIEVEQPTFPPLNESSRETTRLHSSSTVMTTAWEQFQGKIQNRVRQLEQIIHALPTATETTSLYREAESHAHKLAGSLGMFGLQSGYRLAQQIEAWFNAAYTQPDFDPDNLVLLEQLQTWMKQLYQELQRPPRQSHRSINLNKNQFSAAQETARTLISDTSTPLMLIVDDDVELTEQLQREALNWNIRVLVALDLNQARAILLQAEPDIVLLDVAFPEQPRGGLMLLEEMRVKFSQLPVLVFSAQDQVGDRAAVAQLGGSAFLPKSVPSGQVLETIIELLQPKAEKSTILAVDDDPVVLHFLVDLLSSWGLKLTTLEDSRQFWQMLEVVAPDLLILDVDMPYFNGIELCQMVRNDHIWQGLPILFISACQDPEIIQQIYQAGADDYISKPFAEAELATRIFNRLERVQLWRNLAEMDQLTGLTNRRRSIQDLNIYLRLAERNRQTFCLGLLDIDEFKRINDLYGYGVGDNVLRQLGQLLQQQFRGEDIVARWGGEEFLIGWYGMSKDNGMKRMNQLLETIRSKIFRVTRHLQLQITVSASIATYPEDGQELSTLCQAIDTALQQAKTRGRDHCFAASGFFSDH